MRISDWSSDVCSSDLLCHGGDMGFLKTLFGDTSKKIPPKPNISIGHAVLQKYKPFITVKESAKKAALTVLRSEERRVGNESVSTCISLWSPLLLYINRLCIYLVCRH